MVCKEPYKRIHLHSSGATQDFLQLKERPDGQSGLALDRLETWAPFLRFRLDDQERVQDLSVRERAMSDVPPRRHVLIEDSSVGKAENEIWLLSSSLYTFI